MKKPVEISTGFFYLHVLAGQSFMKISIFSAFWLLIFFLGTTLPPSLKVIYDFSHNLQSRKSAFKAKH